MTPVGDGAVPAPSREGTGTRALLGVELDDQLLLDLRVDDRAGRERVDQDLHLARDGLQPRRHRAGTRLRLRHHERRHPAGLLLLTVLEQVLGLLGPAAAVLPGRERPGLERALRTIALAALEEQLHLLAAAALAVRTCVTSHLLSLSLRPGGASADGTR